MLDKTFPKINPKLIKTLEELYPPLEYSQDITKEQWSFRGGQREVISKLKAIYNQQTKGR